MKVVFALFCILTGASSQAPEANNSSSEFILQSPRLTDWGTWGDLESCPKGSFIVGMKLKVQQPSSFQDDTALNGISFQCAEKGDNGFNYKTTLNSTVGLFGSWGTYSECKSGYAFGFQVRSEPNRVLLDDTAANNLRLYCAQNFRQYLEGDGPSWGVWTAGQFCQEGFALCSLRTQVEDEQKQGDNTALNNLDCGMLPDAEFE